MLVSPDQPLVPVLYGGDIGTYSMAREFFDAYSLESVVVLGSPNGIVENSKFIQLSPAGDISDEERLITHFETLAADLNSKSSRPLLLLGSLDLHIQQIARHRVRLTKAAYTIPYADEDKILEASNKLSFTQLCARLHAPHPATFWVKPTEGWNSLPKELPFPLIVKPADSGAWVDAKFEGKLKVHRVDDAAELNQLLNKLNDIGYTSEMILQEFVPGGDENMRMALVYSNRHGEVKYIATAGTVVEEHTPLMLGNSAAIVTMEAPEFAQSCIEVLNDLQWSGFCLIDAKYDSRTGEYKLLEINPRMGRNHFFSTAAGVNPIRLYVEDWMGLENFGTQNTSPIFPTELTSTNADGITTLSNSWLYTAIPHSLVKKFATGETGSRAKKLIKQKRVSNPLKYKHDRSPKRLAYIAATMTNYYRKFRAYPPH